MNDAVRAILARAQDLGVQLRVHEGKLQHSPPIALPDDLRARIRENRESIVRLLTGDATVVAYAIADALTPQARAAYDAAVIALTDEGFSIDESKCAAVSILFSTLLNHDIDVRAAFKDGFTSRLPEEAHE